MKYITTIIFILLTVKASTQVISKMQTLGFNKQTIQEYKSTSKPTFTIKLEGKEDYKKIGNSRIGGVPDLPANLEYPTKKDAEETKHYVFIAQINLEEIPFGNNSIYPQTGILYFYIHHDDDSMSKVEHKVVYSNSPQTQLCKFEPPSNIKYTQAYYDKPFPSQKISFNKEESIDLHYLEDNGQDILQSNDKFHEVFDKTSRFGGHYYSVDTNIPASIIEELEILPYEETFFLTRGYLTGDKLYKNSNQVHFDYYEKKIKEAKSEEEIAKYQKSIKGMEDKIELERKLLPKKDFYNDLLNKWEFMLSIDSIDECDMQWWDASILEFYINKDDLKKKDFSKTFCIINH